MLGWNDNGDITTSKPTIGGIFRLYNATGTAITSEIVPATSALNTGSQKALLSDISPLTGGSFITFWTASVVSASTNLPTNNILYAQTYDSGGQKTGSDKLLLSSSYKYIKDIKVKNLTSGGFLANWSSYADSSLNAPVTYKAQVLDSQLNTSGTEFEIGSPVGQKVFTYSLAGLTNSEIMVVKNADTKGDITNASITAQKYSASGLKSSSEITLVPNCPCTPVITALSGSNFALAWENYESVSGVTTNTGISVQIFNSQGIALSSQINAASTSGARYTPNIISLNNSNFVVIWMDANNILNGQIFDSSGLKIGTEFTITSDVGLITPVGISSTNDGGFVVDWGYDYYNYLNGIKAKIYSR
ncbi:hypothetical protein [Asticcacaulis sp. 201]|uniref:hypothetical protein n=1 Tax=Asticcacaulis sp. 201 TaxID=3028787 RepID=UPI002915E03B|nr:hypothetical protein [Asticcacaulis sp. 201]MDV6332471.1 hypothetical protein [Asticcacaulis sp. 201]